MRQFAVTAGAVALMFVLVLAVYTYERLSDIDGRLHATAGVSAKSSIDLLMRIDDLERRLRGVEDAQRVGRH